MLLKTNQWIGILVITLVSAVFVGCSGGGGGGGAAPVINCQLPQNFSNQTCFNARPGNSRPGGPGGRGITMGAYTRKASYAGMVPLTIANSAFVISLCQRSIDSGGGRGVQSSAYIQNGYNNSGYTNAGYQPQQSQWNNVCMSIGNTAVTINTIETQGQAPLFLWRFYFIPIGVPIAGVSADQIANLGPGSEVFQGSVQSIGGGAFQVNGVGQSSGSNLMFSGIDSNSTLSISISVGPNAVIGSGTMGLQ